MCPISGSGIMGQSRPFDWAKFTRCEGFWSRHASRKGLNFCMISAAAGYIHNEKRTLTSVYWKKKEDKGIEWSQDKMHPSEQMSMFSRRLVKSETYLFACCCCCFCANVQGDCTFFCKRTIQSVYNSTCWRYLLLFPNFDFLFSSSFIFLQASKNDL